MASTSSSADAFFEPVKKVQWTNLSHIITNSSSFIKFICTSLCIGYLLSFSENALDLLAVSPGKMVPPNFSIWTLVTYSFIEVHWWVVIWDILAVLLFCKFIEPVWTGTETVRFYAVVTISSALLSAVTYLILYLPLQDTNLLFRNHITGIAAFISASTVAYKQLVPEAVIFNSPLGKLRSRHLPGWLVIAALALQLVGIVEHSYSVVFLWGAIVGWIYLRFYQPHTGGARGDMTESFSFAYFFPEAVQPFIAILSNTVYALLVTVNICKKVTKRYEVTPQAVIITLPGTDMQDAERRRQLALKALNERLSRVPAAQTWPSVDEDTASSPPAPTPTFATVQSSAPSPLLLQADKKPCGESEELNKASSVSSQSVTDDGT